MQTDPYCQKAEQQLPRKGWGWGVELLKDSRKLLVVMKMFTILMYTGIWVLIIKQNSSNGTI